MYIHTCMYVGAKQLACPWIIDFCFTAYIATTDAAAASCYRFNLTTLS